MNRFRLSLPLIMAALAGTAWSAEPRTEHTYQLAPDETRPAATLDDAGFLVCSWSGTAFGGDVHLDSSSPLEICMIGKETDNE